MTIGKIITKARKRKGLTQEELAAKTSIPRSTIANYEKDIVKDIPLENKMKLAAALDFDVREILVDEEEAAAFTKLVEAVKEFIVIPKDQLTDEFYYKLLALQQGEPQENYILAHVSEYGLDKFAVLKEIAEAIKAPALVPPTPPQDEDEPPAE